MALLTRTGRLNGTQVESDRLKAVADRIQLIDIDPLQRYEQTDPVKVDAIENSLRTTGVLIDPIVVDRERQLLIDGHHRVRAFQSLGLPRIPAFTVDYLSDDLTVESWSHATAAPRETLIKAIDQLDGSPGGAWTLVGISPRRKLASKSFKNALEGARSQHGVDLMLQRENREVILLTAADALQRGLNHSYIRPVVNKNEVIAMVESRELFPPEVNRHLIKDRPLNLCVPVAAIEGGGKRFAEHVGRACEDASPVSIEPGSRRGTRLYEEPVILFQQRRGDL